MGTTRLSFLPNSTTPTEVTRDSFKKIEYTDMQDHERATNDPRNDVAEYLGQEHAKTGFRYHKEGFFAKVRRFFGLAQKAKVNGQEYTVNVNSLGKYAFQHLCPKINVGTYHQPANFSKISKQVHTLGKLILNSRFANHLDKLPAKLAKVAESLNQNLDKNTVDQEFLKLEFWNKA